MILQCASKVNAKTVIGYDRLKIETNPHRQTAQVFGLLVIQGVLQYSPTSVFAAQPGEETDLVYCLAHHQVIKLDLRYLQLLGLGKAHSMRPSFPNPADLKLVKEPKDNVKAM